MTKDEPQTDHDELLCNEALSQVRAMFKQIDCDEINANNAVKFKPIKPPSLKYIDQALLRFGSRKWFLFY